jgi:organic hydroperoxide reductase OsmC/OhrA
MKVTATVNSKTGLLENTVQSDGETKTISIAPKTNGCGSSIKGGELLLLSLATCYCNSIQGSWQTKPGYFSSRSIVYRRVWNG